MSKPRPRPQTKKRRPPESMVELLCGTRQKNESEKAVMYCNEYLRMGVGRSLVKLVEHFNNLQQNSTENSFSPDDTPYITVRTWSSRFKWSERAAQYDSEWDFRRSAERKAVMDYGLALDYERVRKLCRLAEFLEAQIYELSDPDEDGVQVYYNIWMPDVKSIGSGEFATRVDIERFNAPLLEQYRAVLADIAKEVGGRVDKHEVKHDDWRTKAIEDIKAGHLDYRSMVAAFQDESLVKRLFAEAGVSVIVDDHAD